jgi:hypothetical protein
MPARNYLIILYLAALANDKPVFKTCIMLPVSKAIVLTTTLLIVFSNVGLIR